MIVTVMLNPTIDKTLECPGFRVGTHAKVRLRALVPAGKGMNVARGLAALGSEAVACTLVGKNEKKIYAERLQAEGIRGHFVLVDGLTRTNTTVLDPVNRTTTHLREEGFEVGREQLSQMRRLLRDVMARHASGGQGVRVAFCGSLPRGVEPSDFASIVVESHERGAQVIVDASGDALRKAVASGAVHTIKPNLLELAECLGERVEPDRAPDRASELLDRVDTVLLTLGADGAYVIREGQKYGQRCPISPQEVRNTVGAGDAFLAGWLRGCELSDDLAERLRWAVAAGAACVRSETSLGYSLGDVKGLLALCEPM